MIRPDIVCFTVEIFPQTRSRNRARFFMDSLSDRHKGGRNSSFRWGRHETYGLENRTSPLGPIYTQRATIAGFGVNGMIGSL